MTNHIKTAQQVIDIEIEGLEAIKSGFDDKFNDLIDNILNIKGRVILSGMGKSGHIANKIAATMASTGTPAFAIHPGEASHGDLGMITKDDIVILLSNSGETKELSDIINYCKRFAITLVALVRRKTSILVEAADIAIVLPEVQEASEVNAPTTSTTMMLAYGDAVAVALAEAKGFTNDDFSKFHPGGKLGSNFIKVDEIMRDGKDLPICNVNSSMAEAVDVMSQKSLGCVAVLDDSEKLAGIITDGDLRRNITEDIMQKKPADIMTSGPKTLNSNSLALEGVNIMNKYNITSIFVVENGSLKGCLHMHDCFKAGII